MVCPGLGASAMPSDGADAPAGRVERGTRGPPVPRASRSHVHVLCARAFLCAERGPSIALLVLVAFVRVGVVGVGGVRILVRTRGAALGCRQHGDIVLLAPVVPERSGLVRVLHMPVGVRQ